MAEVKAQFPIGKTQWSKWNDEQRTAFNEARAAGVPFADAVEASNDMKKKKSIFSIIEDVTDAAADVAEVAAKVSPVIAVAKTVVKATKKKGK